MRDGEIQQFGSPAEVFDKPENLFVAEFFGALNTLPVKVVAQDGARTLVSWQGLQFAAPSSNFAVGSDVLFAVRTVDTQLSAAPTPEASIPASLRTSSTRAAPRCTESAFKTVRYSLRPAAGRRLERPRPAALFI